MYTHVCMYMYMYTHTYTEHCDGEKWVERVYWARIDTVARESPCEDNI